MFNFYGWWKFKRAYIFVFSLPVIAILFYFQVYQSGPLYLYGILLDAAGNKVEYGSVSYEYKLQGSADAQNTYAIVNSGEFRVSVKEPNIEYVKLTGVYIGLRSKLNYLPSMNTKEETGFFIQAPRATFDLRAQKWDTSKRYVFQVGLPVRTYVSDAEKGGYITEAIEKDSNVRLYFSIAIVGGVLILLLFVTTLWWKRANDTVLFKTLMILMVAVFVIVGVLKTEIVLDDGFHMKGRLLNQQGEALVDVVVGYNYAHKGHKIILSGYEVINGNTRMYPRIFSHVVSDKNGYFSIDIDKEDIGFVTILGFWDNSVSFSKTIHQTQDTIAEYGLPNIKHIMPWKGGVVKNYEPSWKVLHWLFGWDTEGIKVFRIHVSEKVKDDLIERKRDGEHYHRFQRLGVFEPIRSTIERRQINDFGLSVMLKVFSDERADDFERWEIIFKTGEGERFIFDNIFIRKASSTIAKQGDIIKAQVVENESQRKKGFYIETGSSYGKVWISFDVLPNDNTRRAIDLEYFMDSGRARIFQYVH